MAEKVHMTFACAPYDRMAALQTGAIEPAGIRLTYLAQPVEETFWRQLRHEEFEASEISFSSFLIAKARGKPDLIAIPVFPSRSFRHSAIFINVDSGIREPQDLIGKRVGVPEYQLTACLWARGILEDEYGVRPEEIEWFTGGEERPDREEKLPVAPPGIRIQPIGPGRTLSQMLLDGEIDAIIAPRAPSTMHHPSGRVRRLFENYQELEEAYFRKTGIFPIMHTVALKRSFYEKYPWAAQNLYKACVEAKALAMEQLRSTEALVTSYPWQIPAIERTVEVMGEDWWPYGIEPNRKAIETAIRYSVRQGLIPRAFALEELFAPNTFDQYVI
jgi:4,5-dihydroxyphthalate decarboxylase